MISQIRYNAEQILFEYIIIWSVYYAITQVKALWSVRELVIT